MGQLPEPPAPSCPEYAPLKVEKAFIEAEKCRMAEAFSLAAGGYRKAVERAIAPHINEKLKKKPLGIQLGDLEGKNILPKAMLDWIRLVKNDGNFGMHDDDKDFTTNEEVMPARDFAHTLITYLYTMPEKVKIARARFDEREGEG